jgi:hypothetical protein
MNFIKTVPVTSLHEMLDLTEAIEVLIDSKNRLTRFSGFVLSDLFTKRTSVMILDGNGFLFLYLHGIIILVF